jgi:hypothetical protein
MGTENISSEFGAAVSVRNRYAFDIEGVEADILKLQSKLEYLKHRLAVANEIIDEMQVRPPDNATPPLKGFGKYSKMELSKAILDVVQAHGKDDGLLVPESMKHLVAGGYNYKGKSFYSTVYASAQYLVKKDELSETKKEGKRSFVSGLL